MKTLFKLCLLLSLMASCFATTVTLQVTDADSQAWINGTWQAQVIINSSPTTLPLSGTLDGTGAASITLTPNTLAGSHTTFKICPTATSDCYRQDVVIVGSTQTVTLVPPAIRIRADTRNLQAYSDAEVTGASVGNKYYNTTSLTEKTWNGSAWIAPSSGGVQTATVTLTSAQIKALNTTPITLVAAPGAGKALYPNQIVYQYKFGTTAYTRTGAPAFEVGWAPSADEYNQSSAMGSTGFMDESSTANMLGTANVFPGNGGSGNSDLQSLGENKALVIDAASGSFGGSGNGTLVVTVYYTVVTLN